MAYVIYGHFQSSRGCDTGKFLSDCSVFAYKMMTSKISMKDGIRSCWEQVRCFRNIEGVQKQITRF